MSGLNPKSKVQPCTRARKEMSAKSTVAQQNLNGGKAPRKMVQDAKVTLGKTHSNNQEMQAMIFSSFNTRGCGQQASRAGVGF